MGIDGISVCSWSNETYARSSNIGISSGVKDLMIIGGGYFQDSIILATGATVQEDNAVSKFVEDAYNNSERAILFAYEESKIIA